MGSTSRSPWVTEGAPISLKWVNKMFPSKAIFPLFSLLKQNTLENLENKVPWDPVQYIIFNGSGGGLMDGWESRGRVGPFTSNT